MKEEQRATPEELLKTIQSDDNRNRKGRLKIFLGMAPGVGKTYTMLEAAQKRRREGVDLVVGFVDTHQRPETAKLLEGLTILPENHITYKGKEFKECNLDYILKRNPELVILDELAHTNIPGSRNEKRWQDVLEILDANIDVYTTLNVQHVASFKEMVQGIVETQVWETVPDLLLEKASDIELVDLTPQELLERLREGKVYTGEMPTIAIANFFKEDRLTALRELSLLLTADIVDKKLHEMLITFQTREGWKSREKLLVVIDSKWHSQSLIRQAGRRAFTLHASWIALYVDTGEKLGTQEQEMLTNNVKLAKELGAEIITTKDFKQFQGIQRIAEQKEISEILIGREKKQYRDLIFPSLQEQLIKACATMPISITVLPLPLSPPQNIPKKPLFFFPFSPSYLVAFALYISIGYLFWASSHRTFATTSLEDLYVLLLLLSLFLLVGIQIHHIKQKQILLTKREQSTQAIYEIVRDIASAPSEKELLEGFKKKVGSILKGTCQITLGDDQLIFDSAFDKKEEAIALWVFQHGKEAGWSTPTLSSSQQLHIPLKGFKKIVGVLSFHPHQNLPLSIEEVHFLYTIIQQLAHYIERSFTETQENELRLLEKTEKIYNKVLHAIVSELEGPLKVIKKNLMLLKKDTLPLSLQEIDHATDQLSRVEENAAAMEKLSAGFIQFQKTPQNLSQLIQTCIEKIAPSLKEHRLIINIANTLPSITLDAPLIEILLSNLLINAATYSPRGSCIEIEAECVDKSFILSVADEGPGIPDEIMDKIFDKFYRAPGATSSGLGLGLAIASSIASIHQGEIRVQNRPTRGAKFFLILPT